MNIIAWDPYVTPSTKTLAQIKKSCAKALRVWKLSNSVYFGRWFPITPVIYDKNAFLESYGQKVMAKKMFWSRDRLDKHEFNSLGLGLGLTIVNN